MNRALFSRIAHGLLPMAAPLDPDVLGTILALISLDERSRVLDVGCGRAALLLDLTCERGVQGTGVDVDPDALHDARASAIARGCSERVAFVASPALDTAWDEPFDVTVCIGASHALGGPHAALEHLARWTRPGGHCVWGEGFWRRDPDTAYLAWIGGTADELSTHHGNAVAARDRGWSPIWSAVTSDAAWDRYEGLYRLAMSRHLAQHPDDPDADAFRAHSERWYDGYLRWGRDTMGFALYLLERRGETSDSTRP